MSDARETGHRRVRKYGRAARRVDSESDDADLAVGHEEGLDVTGSESGQDGENDSEQVRDAPNDQEYTEDPQPQDPDQAGTLRNQLSLDEYMFEHGLTSRQRELAKSSGIKLCKAAMATELKGQMLTKGFITKYVLENQKLVKFSHVFRFASFYLDRLGFELVAIPNKNETHIELEKAVQGLAHSYMVRSKLPQRYSDIIGDYFITEANDDWNSAAAGGMGPLTVLIWVVILHKNNIGKLELVTVLNKFGVKNSTVFELITRAVREEYVVEEVVKNSTNDSTTQSKRRRITDNGKDEFVTYAIGRRTLVEFPKERMLAFLRELYRDDFDAERVEESLKFLPEADAAAA